MTNDKYKIIISISHRRISFEYWQMGSGEEKLLPMPGCEWPAPLAFYSSPTGIVVGEEAQRAAANGTKDAFGQYFEYLGTNKTYSYGEQQKSIGNILLDAAETFFSRFFREVLLNKYGSLTDNRATMPLTIVCEADIKSNERAYISNLFTDSGFNQTKVVDYDDYIANHCSDVLSKQYTCNKVLVAWTEGSDLDFTLFDVNDKNKRQHETLPNLGIDPRFEYVKNLIWSDFCEQNPFLMRKSVEGIINREATDFLNSSAPTVKAQITLPDGIKYQYYLDRNRINFLQSDNSIVIKQGLDKFLNSANVSKGETLLILRGIAANNAYFEQTLSHGFLKIVKSDGKLRGDIMKLLIKDSTPTPPDGTKQPVVEPPTPPTPPSPPGPTRDDKKKVRLATAEIKGKIRIKDFDDARNQIQNLSDELRNMGLLPFFDAEIEELRKLIPAPRSPQDKTPKQPPLPPVAPTHDWKREVKTTMAEAKAKARCGNKEEAVNIAKDLLVSLHTAGEHRFDEEITTFISEHSGPVQKPTKLVTDPAPVSRATKLLQEGRFVEAKKEFAKEQNSEMAQVCTSLIKSTKTIEMYSSGLESVKRNKNKSAVALALKALTETRQLYAKHNIDTQKIDSLITEYKQIK